MLRCMSATRTQVYLTDLQRRQIDAIVEHDGVTMAVVIRTALDEYLEAHPADAEPALASTFGALPGIGAPDRDEWDRG